MELKDNYYPFGLTFNEYQRESSVANNYQYNGKEKQDELRLDWYDYITRQYDPALGRFLSNDPAAGLMRRFSPYAYAFDNPARFTDPDGIIPFDGVERGENFDRDKYDIGPLRRAPIDRDRGFCKNCDESDLTFFRSGLDEGVRVGSGRTNKGENVKDGPDKDEKR